MRRAHAAPPRYKACVIGDTKQGGHGHNLHMVWGAREDVAVAGLADPDAKGREKHAAEAKAARTYADYREMLEKEQPDLVSIGPRWSVRHQEYLEACAAVGAHGLIEKPIAADLAEADAMVAAADAKGLKWAIAYNFRATPVYQHARRLILEQGLIGEVLELRARGKEDRRSGGEDLIVLGTHVFDMMIDLIGRPQWCVSDIQVEGRKATAADIREATEPLGLVIGDSIQAAFGFAGGVHGYFSSQKNPDGNGGRWGLDIYGTKGIVTIRLTEIPQIHWMRSPSWSPGKQGAQWEALPGMPAMAYKNSHVERYAPIIDGLIEAIEKGGEPNVSLRDGLHAHEMIQAVFASHVSGRRVALPLAARAHPLKG